MYAYDTACALVESVAGEWEYVCEEVASFCFGVSFLQCAFDECFFGFLHYLGNLFAHGFSQYVGFAERVSCELAGYQHDLVLVDDDSVGLFEDVLQAWVRVSYGCATVFGVDELVDVLHWPRSVECDH